MSSPTPFLSTERPQSLDNVNNLQPAKRPSPLVQLLKEVPAYQELPINPASSSDAVNHGPPKLTTSSRFPPTSKLAGRQSTGTGAGSGTRSSTSVRRAASRVIKPLPETYERAASPSMGRTSRLKSKRASSRPRHTLDMLDTVGFGPPAKTLGHLPQIKRPSLSGELRRRVLLSTTLSRVIPVVYGNVGKLELTVNHEKPANSLERSGLGGRQRDRANLPLTDSNTRDLANVVKGICQTLDEPVFREKRKKPLQDEAAKKQLEGNVSTSIKHSGHNSSLMAKNARPEVPKASTNDTRTTGTSTRNLRQHLTSGKISHKKEVLERAFGWNSHLIDLDGIEEQVGRSTAVRKTDESSGLTPMSGTMIGGEEWIGAIKVPGSVESDRSEARGATHGWKGSSGNRDEWVDVEGSNGDEDTILDRNGVIRKGRIRSFQLDHSRIPPTPNTKFERRQPLQVSALHNRSSTNLSLSSSPIKISSNQQQAPSRHIQTYPTKRTLQHFNRVEDWIGRQKSHEQDNQSTQYPLTTKTAHVTQMPKQRHSGTVQTQNSTTPSASLLDKKYLFSLAHLPYVKYKLKSNGRRIKGGGIVTISPPTESDPLGYIHLDLRGKRHIYTIIPGSESGTLKVGKRSLIILHPRAPEPEEEDRIYELSELPVKHFSVVKFANKFVSIVRRGTVVMRIEGQTAISTNPGSYTPLVTVVNRAKWEYYRGEMFADGRFEFIAVPRGGMMIGHTESHTGETAEKTTLLVGGMVQIIFTSSFSSKAAADGAIPRITNGGSSGKFKRVYAEISCNPPLSSTGASGSSSIVWEGLVDLGRGSASGRSGTCLNDIGDSKICGGLGEEVDWARRAWIECRRLRKGV